MKHQKLVYGVNFDIEHHETSSHRSIPLPTLKPALAPKVKLSLTVGYISIFGLIFLVAYVQLWMIWYYRHRRLSHQTLFLALCLIWSGLRTFLFSVYFNDCSTPDQYLVLYCLLYVLPVCLQFSMLCLLLHYFALVVFKSTAKYELRQYRCPLLIFTLLSMLVFTLVNLSFAIVIKWYEKQGNLVPSYIVYLRVTLTEILFLVYGILFSICIFKMSTVAASRRVLEAKGTTVCKASAVNILVMCLFLSRAIYNLITITEHENNKTASFGYDWINVSDQAEDVTHLSDGLSYVSFGVVLFVWEVLPIAIVLLYFRVRRLQANQVMTDFSGKSVGSRVFFFDNPRRYDSVDDLSNDGPSSHCDSSNVRSSNGITPRSSISAPGSMIASMSGSLTSSQVNHGDNTLSGDPRRFFTRPTSNYGSINHSNSETTPSIHHVCPPQ